MQPPTGVVAPGETLPVRAHRERAGQRLQDAISDPVPHDQFEVTLEHCDLAQATDQRPRGEVLAGAGPDVLGTLGQQFLVRVALDVGAGSRPVLLVDQIDDQPLELGRVLDAVLRLGPSTAEADN